MSFLLANDGVQLSPAVQPSVLRPADEPALNPGQLSSASTDGEEELGDAAAPNPPLDHRGNIEKSSSGAGVRWLLPLAQMKLPLENRIHSWVFSSIQM